MQAEINGTTIRFVSSGNGLERAAFDFNSGPPTGHLHVYVTSVFQDTGRQVYACTDKPLTKEQIIGLAGCGKSHESLLHCGRAAL